MNLIDKILHLIIFSIIILGCQGIGYAAWFEHGLFVNTNVDENQPAGTELIRLPVNNPDGDTLHFYLISGRPLLDIEVDGNEVIVKTNILLDYENITGFFASVTVWSDLEADYCDDQVMLLVSINNDTSDDDDPVNNSPEFTDEETPTYTIEVNTPAFTEIGSPLTTTDADNDTLSYGLIYTYSGLFSIDSSTGQIQTEKIVEFSGYYKPIVWVHDGKGGYDAIQIIIHAEADETSQEQQIVEPQNNPPEFSSDLAILNLLSNTAKGTNIGSPYTATDDDTDDTLTYSIGPTDDHPDDYKLFSIDSETGQLSTNADSYDVGEYHIRITVSDGNDGSDTIDITINVNAPNPNPQNQGQNTRFLKKDSLSIAKQEDTQNQQQTNPNEEITSDGQEQTDQPETESTDEETSPDEPIIPLSKLSVAGQVGFSEVMTHSRGGLHSKAQWIELYNNSETEVVNLREWKLEIEARDVNGQHRSAIITLENLLIPTKQAVLIVTFGDRNSQNIPDEHIYNFFNHHYDEFEQNTHRNMVLGQVGFYLKLTDPDGKVSDEIGNLDGDSTTKDEPIWTLPSGTTSDIRRTSLMRWYNPRTDVPLDGTKANNWRRSSELNLSETRYWGNQTDYGNPGYRRPNAALPVSLSYFRAEVKDSQVVIKWTTEAEIENAGFNILRSLSKQGSFAQVNPSLIQGAGTTGKRSEYAWIDTTAKPDIEYYYQIEDISFTGTRTTLVTSLLKGIFAAENRAITQWGQLKLKN